MDRRLIVGMGEVLWDVFPDATRFGGAPANFACSAAGLGKARVNVGMVSSVGRDELGEKALESLAQRDVFTSFVTAQDKPTGQVHVQLDESGSPSYEIATDAAWDCIAWSDNLEQLARRIDAVCFGTLGQRSEPSRTTIQRFIAATSRSALRIFDVNLRRPFVSDSVILESLELANVLKLNDEELPVVAQLCGVSGADRHVLRQLVDRFDLRLAALTRGPQGAVLVRSDQVSECGGFRTDVVDTVGAGDAFTAAVTLGLLAGDDLDAMNRTACAVAAFVCSQSGATPAIPNEPIAHFNSTRR